MRSSQERIRSYVLVETCCSFARGTGQQEHEQDVGSLRCRHPRRDRRGPQRRGESLRNPRHVPLVGDCRCDRPGLAQGRVPDGGVVLLLQGHDGAALLRLRARRPGAGPALPPSLACPLSASLPLLPHSPSPKFSFSFSPLLLLTHPPLPPPPATSADQSADRLLDHDCGGLRHIRDGDAGGPTHRGVRQGRPARLTQLVLASHPDAAQGRVALVHGEEQRHGSGPMRQWAVRGGRTQLHNVLRQVPRPGARHKLHIPGQVGRQHRRVERHLHVPCPRGGRGTEQARRLRLVLLFVLLIFLLFVLLIHHHRTPPLFRPRLDHHSASHSW